MRSLDYFMSESSYRSRDQKSTPLNEIERVQAELENFFSLSVELFCVITAEGCFKRINPAFEKAMGYSISELDSKTFFDFVHPEDVESTLKELKKMESDFQSERFENRFRAKSGEYRIVSWATSKDVQNGVFYCAARDLTSQKQAELKVLASAKMASLGEMASGVAHEINNPLTIIRSKVQKVIRQMETETQIFDENSMTDLQKLVQRDLRIILETTDRIAKIVKGLQTFSRDSSNDPMEVADLEVILNDALSICQQKLKQNDITLTCETSDSIQVECRGYQLSQVLLNLINNSFDAVVNLAEKWIHIEIKKMKRGVQVIVTDSGRGIPQAVVSKMMQPFFTTKEVGKGTGLGLSISTGIVADHGGRLFYDPNGPHTRFVIELPLNDTIGRV